MTSKGIPMEPSIAQRRGAPDLTRVPDLSHARPMRPLVPRRPVYLDRMAPCNAACRAGEDVQAWLDLAQAGRYEEAFRVLTTENPLPAVLGRICYRPCESNCNRSGLDAPVSIHAVERFLGDEALRRGFTFAGGPPSGKRVLVVGAGPSGLTAAYHLRRRGHDVEIRDAGRVAGGMMAVGIPPYRLPRDVLAAEVARIEAMGVRIVLGHTVDDVVAAQTRGGFDAVFVAAGAHIGKRTEIPARDASKVLDALGFLEDVAHGEPPVLGRRVAIYGGGNTAMDAARVAARLGHEPLVVYRRDRSHMPATGAEVDAAVAEGIEIHWLRTIRALDADGMEVEIMELDGDGRPRGTGRFETLAADSLLLALGQDVDARLLERAPGIEVAPDGVVAIGADMMTGHPGIFAGGDMVASERTAAVAVGQGAAAAAHIDAFLCGASAPEPRVRAKGPVARLSDLRLWYRTDASRTTERELDEAARARSFEEVTAGLRPEQALFEAKRCLSCGNCFECDGCLGACPSGAVVKLGRGQRYRFDYDRCTGCAVCFDQCPVHAIHMTDTALEVRP
ncbi:MAG: NAD(P)-binding protein [Polyangiaceae bacterium]